MERTREARPGKLASLVLAAAVLAVVLAWAMPAFAATIDVGGTVYEGKCTYCHANIAGSKPGAEIKFSHAYHMTYACSACHTQFPHQPQGTSTPKMSNCFACHNLRHGPQGKLAKGDCVVCHNTPRAQLKPGPEAMSAPDHTVVDWAGKGHVAPANASMRTVCMMCHDQSWCDGCHQQKGVMWKSSVPYTFDPQQRCQVCHGQTNLTKAASDTGFQSFQVMGVQDSAHAQLSCTSCHVDFRYFEAKYTYSDGTQETNLWEVNAGLGCRDCHEGKVPGYQKQTAAWTKVVSEYDSSIHRQVMIGTGGQPPNLQSATCSSCHGGHDIQRLDTPAAKAAFHASAYQVCARCHLQQYNSYNDYYHGAAYKQGAPDAPACWDCHGSHAVLPASDKGSMISAENLPTTCGKCHAGSKANFAANAASMIHQKNEVQATNILQRAVNRVKSWFSFL